VIIIKEGLVLILSFSIFISLPFHGAFVEAMNVLSDDGSDVNDDWHNECLAEEDSEGLQLVTPV